MNDKREGTEPTKRQLFPFAPRQSIERMLDFEQQTNQVQALASLDQDWHLLEGKRTIFIICLSTLFTSIFFSPLPPFSSICYLLFYKFLYIYCKPRPRSFKVTLVTAWRNLLKNIFTLVPYYVRESSGFTNGESRKYEYTRIRVSIYKYRIAVVIFVVDTYTPIIPAI